VSMVTDEGGELRRGEHVMNPNTQTIQGWWHIPCVSNAQNITKWRRLIRLKKLKIKGSTAAA